MNKYLKILLLSGGVLGAVAPTAIDMDNNTNNDFCRIYENVERMQQALPKLSRINYKLDIANTDEPNIKFISTDDTTGEETDVSEEETINYLNETLNQTNIEYEQLKTVLSDAIRDTMNYLDKCKNGETELTNEQKLIIKEHTNSIKFLAETLENLSEDVICCIDGCEDREEDYEVTAGKYISAINDLEARIEALQSSISSLHFINTISSPYFYAGYGYAPDHIYGMHPYNPDIENTDSDLNINNGTTNSESNHTTDNSNNITDNKSNSVDSNENEDNTLYNPHDSNNTDNTIDDNNIDNTPNIDNADNQVQEVEQTTSEDIVDNNDYNEDDKPTTFGLKSNIDTYAPTKRNIDTFFNTALYNNDYAYGGGHYMPYGYGGGYGYGMPYGNGYGYGNPYGASGLNSNMVNREVVDNHEHLSTGNNINTIANVEKETQEDTKQSKKRYPKRAKNVDTYTGTTIQSNVNTMGESKISKFFKDKFNNLRNKIRKNKNNDNVQELPQEVNHAENNLNNEITENSADNSVVNTGKVDNQVASEQNKTDSQLQITNELANNENPVLESNNANQPAQNTISQDEPIKARN